MAWCGAAAGAGVRGDHVGAATRPAVVARRAGSAAGLRGRARAGGARARELLDARRRTVPAERPRGAAHRASAPAPSDARGAGGGGPGVGRAREPPLVVPVCGAGELSAEDVSHRDDAGGSDGPRDGRGAREAFPRLLRAAGGGRTADGCADECVEREAPAMDRRGAAGGDAGLLRRRPAVCAGSDHRHCGLPPSTDPRSVRFNGIMGPANLDTIDESVW